MTTNTLAAIISALALLCGCGASPKINVGNESDGSVAGFGGASGSGGLGGSSGGGNALTAIVTEPPSEIAIEVITISCAGECKQVLAIARGGNAPYTFSWNDGVTTAAREICTDGNTTFSVMVNDTAIIDGEFTYAGQSTSVSVTTNVLSCPADGGVPGGVLCIENPSLEGTPAALPGAPFDALPWDPCPNGVNAGRVVNETNSTAWVYPRASHGNTAGAIGTNSGFGGSAYLAQTLCEAIPAGEVRSFQMDVARNAYSGSSVEAVDAQVQIYGGSGMRCAEAELLWTSPLLTPEWQTVCATIAPQESVTSLAFKPLGDGNPLFLGLMGAVIDNIVPVEACP